MMPNQPNMKPIMTNLTMGGRACLAAGALDRHVCKPISRKVKAILADLPSRLMCSENRHLKTKSHWESFKRSTLLY
jgi:hypothetical protein